MLSEPVLVAALLGLLQGTTEWLPVSSDGVVSATYTIISNRPLDEALAYALWLHLGTVVAALVALRRDVWVVLREVMSFPRRPSPMLSFLLVATLVSGLIGLPLLIALKEMANWIGAFAMGVVGLFMLATGLVLLRQRVIGTRGRMQVNLWDGILAGIAQGLAALPGLSRSGMTVSILLARKMDRREALVLSFLMSIPASLGAALYSGATSGLVTSADSFVGLIVSCGVGLVAIKGLLALAQRINFGVLVLTLGTVLLMGGIWQAFL